MTRPLEPLTMTGWSIHNGPNASNSIVDDGGGGDDNRPVVGAVNDDTDDLFGAGAVADAFRGETGLVTRGLALFDDPNNLANKPGIIACALLTLSCDDCYPSLNTKQ